MIPRLKAPLRESALGALLEEGWLLQRSGLLKRLLEELRLDEIPRIRELGRPLPASNPEHLAELLLAMASSAKALSRNERRTVLEECMAIAPSIADAEARARRLCDMAAVAAECAPEARERLLQSAWDVIRTLRPNRKGEPVLDLLEPLLDQLEALAPSVRQEVIDAAWRRIDDQELGWHALSRLGPGLARNGLTSRVLKRCDAILSSARHEHTRGSLLASLLPYGGDLSEQIVERLRRLKRRDLALDPLTSKLRYLTPKQRDACISEVLEVVSRSPSCAYLLGRLGGQMSPNDPDVSRLLAAIRRLEDPESRAQRLVDCLHFVPEAECSSTVGEILRGARTIRIIELKKRLVTRLVTALQAADDDWVPSVLAVSRQVGDEGHLSEAVDRIAVMLAKAGNVEEAAVLARQAAETFAREPYWGVETYVQVLGSLSHGDARDRLWEHAAQLASALPIGFTRAALLASLARTAPNERKRQHLAAARREIEVLTDPFHRTYARIMLLDGHDPDARRSEIEVIVASLTNEVPRSARFRLIPVLLAHLSSAECALHGGLLEEVLVESSRHETPPEEPDDDRSPLHEYGYLERLAPFLNATQVSEVLAMTSPSSVSDVEALVVRLAELGRPAEALRWARELENPDDYFRCLARILDHLSGVERTMSIEEVRQHLQSHSDRRESALTAAFLVPHLPEPERKTYLRSALVDACAIGLTGIRRRAMHRLADLASQELAPDDLGAVWADLLDRIAKQRREDLVTDLVSLTPIALRVGGPASVRMIGETLLDLTEWFP